MARHLHSGSHRPVAFTLSRPAFSRALVLLPAWLGLGCANTAAAPEVAKPSVIRLDDATYNPVSLLLKEKGYLESALKPEGIGVEWVKSVGSNKALELLNSSSALVGG